ncbi:MAG: carboxypeptidase-like regulatory domain-containing protein, partial [Defluviitaleaceae bacterium]|nr:carboxypeptidase-like regulatory domain-containing protein [Defluviitaleaceae bacterium]
MGIGYLEVVVTTASGSLPVARAQVTVLSGDTTVHRLTTDESGLTEIISLPAPAKELTLAPEFMDAPYSLCDVRVEAPGFMITIIHNVEILDTETTILPINLLPAQEDGQVNEIDLPPHKQTQPAEERFMEWSNA